MGLVLFFPVCKEMKGTLDAAGLKAMPGDVNDKNCLEDYIITQDVLHLITGRKVEQGNPNGAVFKLTNAQLGS